jgi:hypothetical protein
MITLIEIKDKYPILFQSAMKYYIFDKKIKDKLNDKYGINSYNTIYELNEFNQEIENIKKNPNANNKYSSLAKKYNMYFTEYTNQMYLLKNIIGSQNMFVTMDMLRKYFQDNGYLYY